MAAEEEELVDDLQKDGKRTSISDYLQVPKKKRKNYIILAFKEGFDEDIVANMLAFCKQHYPMHAVSQPTNIAELRRQFNRNITVLIIDDEMDELAEVVQAVTDLKTKRKSEKIPVMFFTRNAKDLIESYHEHLLAFHEVDDYLVYPKMQRQEILGRIKIGIEQQNRRKTRRYSVNIPVTFFHLNSNESLPGRFVDLSVHGARIRAAKDFIFRDGDQLKISIPVGNYMKHEEGDYLKISARVRRVLMSGNTAAVSFEFLSDHQFLRLTMLVTGIVNQQMLLSQKAAKMVSG